MSWMSWLELGVPFYMFYAVDGANRKGGRHGLPMLKDQDKLKESL